MYQLNRKILIFYSQFCFLVIMMIKEYFFLPVYKGQLLIKVTFSGFP